MPSIWERLKAAREKQKTPEGQKKLKEMTNYAMDQTEGLMGAGTVSKGGAAARAAARRASGAAGRALARAARSTATEIAEKAKPTGTTAKKIIPTVAQIGFGAGAYALSKFDKSKQAAKEQDETKAPVAAPAKPVAKPETKPVAKPVESEKKTPFSSEYKTYKSGSSEASDFRKNFAAARKSGAKEFEWQGRKYTTKIKGE
jgi:hypothetical protein